MQVFEKAGAIDIRERVFRFNIAASLSFENFFEARSEMSDSLRAKLRALPEQRRTAFKRRRPSKCGTLLLTDRLQFPTAEVLLISGQKKLIRAANAAGINRVLI